MHSALSRIITAAIAGMKNVRARQLDPAPLAAEVKVNDGTLVTAMDRISEAAIIAALGELPGYAFIAEEGSASGPEGKRGYIDPLDGTRAFAVGGSSSTIIVATVDPKSGVELCVTGEPSTGRIWMAVDSTPTQRAVYDYTTDQLSAPQSVRVWGGSLGKRSTVFLDVSRGFQRGTRQILTNEQIHEFFRQLASRTHVLMFGSNGNHLALVANGSEGSAGSITTAMGGPWDVCGVKLVLNAGGYAAAFHKTSSGNYEPRDPLQVDMYDILISANSPDTLASLCSVFQDIATKEPTLVPQ